MHWTERDGVWVSGPYTIELIEPRSWAMTRRSPDSSAANVEVEDERWTGHSLQAMKQRAEWMEADVDRVRNRNRHLSIAVVALVVFVMVAGSSGQLAAILAIASAGTLIYGLVRAVDEVMSRRPWDNLSETYQ